MLFIDISDESLNTLYASISFKVLFSKPFSTNKRGLSCCLNNLSLNISPPSNYITLWYNK